MQHMGYRAAHDDCHMSNGAGVYPSRIPTRGRGQARHDDAPDGSTVQRSAWVAQQQRQRPRYVRGSCAAGMATARAPKARRSTRRHPWCAAARYQQPNAASYQRPCDCTDARDRRSTPTRMRVRCCPRLGPCVGRVDLLPTPPDERHHAAVNDIPARHPESHSLTAPAGPWPRRRRHRPAQARSNHERSKRERP